MMLPILSIRVKELRKERKWSQKELAEKIDVSESFISKVESGKKQPSREVTTKISEVLNVTTDYLLGLSEHKKLDENQSSEVKIELEDMISRIEKLDEDKQKLILNMIKGAVNNIGD